MISSVGRPRVERAAPASSVASISRCADIGAALGLLPAVTLPSQIVTTPARTGSTTARKSRSLTPTRLISFCAILAAHVLLRTPCALAVTPLTDGNIRTAATAWIDNPAAATTTYGAISEWDVSAVSDMATLFHQTLTFNADIGRWNVARVTSLFGTFASAAAFNGDIGSWNVASVTNLYGTFGSTAVFNADIGRWNVASVANLHSAFNSASVFNQPVGRWNTASVTSMTGTFASAAAFNGDIGSWNVASVTILYAAFTNAAAFNRDISEWNTARVANMQDTFNGAAAFNRDIGKWNVASVTTLYQTFGNAATFNRDIGKWNVARVTTLVGTEPTRREAQLAKIAAAKKTCAQHIVAFLVAVFEDVPMGTLTVIFTVRMYKIPIAVILSLVTTGIMLGMKLNKLTLLKYWYAIARMFGAAEAGESARMTMSRAVGGTRWATGRESSTTTR